jgi:hypothetical protein
MFRGVWHPTQHKIGFHMQRPEDIVPVQRRYSHSDKFTTKCIFWTYTYDNDSRSVKSSLVQESVCWNCVELL